MRSKRKLHTNTPSDHIVVGIVRGSRGLRGELRVEVTTEISERFDVSNTLFLDGQMHTIISSKFDSAVQYFISIFFPKSIKYNFVFKVFF